MKKAFLLAVIMALGITSVAMAIIPPPPPSDLCYEGQTAWAEGTRYVTKGTWAMYVPYAGSAKTVTLYAGQYMPVGTAYFSEARGGNVTITINLTGAVFAEVYENLKIQDYDIAPTTKPSIGLFEHKWTIPFEITYVVVSVPEAAFYGVHLDVAVPIECPIIIP